MKRTQKIHYYQTWLFAVICAALLLGLPAGAHAQCGHVQIKSVSASGAKDKKGVTNPCMNSSPPQYFLVETTIGSYRANDQANNTNGMWSYTENGTVEDTEVQTYDRNTGNLLSDITSLTANYSYSDAGSNQYTENGSAAANDTGSLVDYLDNDTNSTVTESAPSCSPATYYSVEISGSLHVLNWNGSDEEDATWNWNELNAFSSPYTDPMLRSDAINNISYPSNWNSAPANWADGSSQASYSLSSDHTHASVSKMKYCFYVTVCQSGSSYRVTWDQVTTYPSGSTSVQHMHVGVGGNGDPVNGVYTPIYEVDVPGTPSTVTEENIKITLSSSDTPGS